MKKVLLLTVGTGTRPDADIVRPLVKTIKDSAPTFTVFIASEVSKRHVAKIVEQMGILSDQYEIVLLPDPDSLENVYGEINAAVRSLILREYSPEEMTIDFTSGTKAMTSGAILAGVAWEVSGLKYITGKRKNGIVQNGTERFITEQPNKILAHRKIEFGRHLIEAFRFEGAIELFASVNRSLLEAGEIELLNGLENIAKTYDAWDRFMQNQVDGYLKKVPGSIKELKKFILTIPIRQRLIILYKSSERGEIVPDLLADVFNNAVRRFHEGKYDDAVSRLYRLVEMLAQMVLMRDHRIPTENIPEDQIPQSLQERMWQSRDSKDGHIKIGLHLSYELLNSLGNAVGATFLQDKKLSALLEERNKSFLAHGTKPISRGACSSLLEETRILIQSYMPDFVRVCGELQFPWWKNESS